MTIGSATEHDDLRAAVRSFLGATSSIRDLRGLLDSGQAYDPVIWRRMATELGLHALAIPGQYGGLGCSAVEVGIVMEELGRVLYSGPYFSTVVMAANVIIASGDEPAMAAYLPAIAAGEIRATMALLEPSARFGPGQVAAIAEAGPHGWLLSGVKTFVLDADGADLILALARTDAADAHDAATADADAHDAADDDTDAHDAADDDTGTDNTGADDTGADDTGADSAGHGLSLFCVPRDAAGLRIDVLECLDQTRRQCRVSFDRTPARLIGGRGQAWPGTARAIDLSAVALAAEQVGGTRRCLEMAVQHAQSRMAFDRVIGSFQAIKHTCADMWIAANEAAAAASHAALVAATDPAGLPAAAAVAQAYCSAAYVKAAADNIHIHGGIGFTWEHDAHFYFRRAKSAEFYLGPPGRATELIARHLGL
jgi:alkylation response protein AidB-like acyl-CoA dehydrogenase